MLPTVSQNLKYLIHIIVVWQIFSPVSTTNSNDTSISQICDSLRKEGGAKLNVLSVGLIENNLVLVTKDFYVYEVPASSMDDAINTLYLKSKPIPMSQKYPKLWQSSDFKAIKDGYIFNSFLMIDVSNTSYLCMTTKSSATHSGGINYNLRTSQIINGWSFSYQWDEALISTQEPGHFYSIILPGREGSKSAQINKYQVYPNVPINQNSAIGTLDDFKNICWTSSEQQEIVAKLEQCAPSEPPVTWSVYRGFVQNKKFYLFGDTGVLIFNEDLYNGAKPYPVLKKSYNSFFWCPGEVQPSTAGNYLWLIILLIFLLLILLCMLLYCVLWITQRKRRRRRKFKIAPSGTMSMRSESSLAFIGILTRMTSQRNSSYKSTNKTGRSKFSKNSTGALSRKKNSSTKLTTNKSRKKSKKDPSKF